MSISPYHTCKNTWRKQYEIKKFINGCIVGFSGWFLGEIKLFTMGDFMEFWARILMTAGFMFMGITTLVKRKRLEELRYMIVSIFSMGIVMAFAMATAFSKAMFNRKLHWYCTPKIANADVMKNGA